MFINALVKVTAGIADAICITQITYKVIHNTLLIDSRIVLPFKDQRSADMVKKHLSDLSNKIDHILQPVFSSRKLSDDLKVQEPKPPLINQQCVVHHFVCDLCDADYVGYTSRHLHQRIDEHRFSAIGKHLKNNHHWRPDKKLHNLKEMSGKA